MLTPARVKSLAGWTLTLGIVALWFVALRPPMLGGPASTVSVKGDSMVPTFEDGDLVVVHEQDRYEVGDVVAFKIPQGELAAGARVIHRIVGGDAKGYELQGDNNPYTDQWRPSADDIIGKRWLHIPQGASLLANLRRPIVLASLAALAGFLVVVTWTPRRRKPEAEGHELAAAPLEAVRPSKVDLWWKRVTVTATLAAILLPQRRR